MTAKPLSRQQVRWSSTPTDGGQVVYEVDKVGTFTLGFDHASYPRGDDEERLHVAYGEWDGRGHCYRDRPLPHAPVVNTITLVGGSFFDPAEALAFLTEEKLRPWVGWLRPSRVVDRWAVDVPDRTRARVGMLVARMTQDFLERDDYAELLHAHRARHAPDRAAAHQANLARVEREIAEWIHRRDHEQLLLRTQQLLLDGNEPGRIDLAPPPWRDYQSAATRDGEAFLIATVGSRKAG